MTVFMPLEYYLDQAKVENALYIAKTMQKTALCL